MELENFEMVPTDRSLGPMGLVDQVAEIYRTKTKSYLDKSIEPIPVGISCAGPLDPIEGRLLTPANLTNGNASWSNFPLIEKIEEKLKVPACLENDAAAAALAELWVGKGKGSKDFMILTLGTGLGTAVVRDGEILRASGGLHTEIGHSIINFDETPSRDEVRVQGSLESYVGPKFFLMKFSEARGEKTSGEDFIELVLKNDALALKFCEEYKRVLIAGMFNFFLAYAPDIYIFQGGFSPLIDIIKPDLEKEFKNRVAGFCRPDRNPPRIEISEMSRTCGVYGAAYRIFNKVV